MSQTELQGSWTHSFEEDQGDIQVYRPTNSFAFPPTRGGRETLEFGDGGQFQMLSQGPDDRPRSTGGSWTALGMNRFRQEGAEGTGETIEIIEQTPELLKIRKLPT